MDRQPPASPDCPHPTGQVKYTDCVNFTRNQEAWHCPQCGRYWLVEGQDIREWQPPEETADAT